MQVACGIRGMSLCSGRAAGSGGSFAVTDVIAYYIHCGIEVLPSAVLLTAKVFLSRVYDLRMNCAPIYDGGQKRLIFFQATQCPVVRFSIRERRTYRPRRMSTPSEGFLL